MDDDRSPQVYTRALDEDGTAPKIDKEPGRPTADTLGLAENWAIGAAG